MSNYAILRTAKIKDNAKITAVAEHNLRLRWQPNIDKEKSKDNLILINTLDASPTDASDLQKKLNQHFEKLKIKIRTNNVRMMEFVVSASPEFFEGKSKEEIEDWGKHQLEFFKLEYGDQLKHGVLHQDENSPHCHFLISTEIKSVKKYKNQKGEFFKETWSLNADRYDPEYLVDLQTRYADHNAKFGLIRGLRGSKRTHKPVKDFYKLMSRATNAKYAKQIDKVIDSLEKDFLLKNVSVQEIKSKFAPIIEKILATQQMIIAKLKFDYQAFALKLMEAGRKLKWDQDKLKKDISEFEKVKTTVFDINQDLLNQLHKAKETISAQKLEIAAINQNSKVWFNKLIDLGYKVDDSKPINQVLDQSLDPAKELKV